MQQTVSLLFHSLCCHCPSPAGDGEALCLHVPAVFALPTLPFSAGISLICHHLSSMDGRGNQDLWLVAPVLTGSYIPQAHLDCVSTILQLSWVWQAMNLLLFHELLPFRTTHKAQRTVSFLYVSNNMAIYFLIDLEKECANEEKRSEI